jgi:hypothetical protein
LGLGVGLGIELDHVGVIWGSEADDTLAAFMADINAHKHGLVGDLGTIA